MHSNLVQLPHFVSKSQAASENQPLQIQIGGAPDQQRTPYEEAEDLFAKLILVDELDKNLLTYASEIQSFESTLAWALRQAYKQPQGSDTAHLFVQRILYRINRLNLFWYDELQNYTNERSLYLQQIRNHIEKTWQRWEAATLEADYYQNLPLSGVKAALSRRAAADLDPPLSAEGAYLRQQMSFEGYRYLLAIASFDGLIEASRLSRILGGAANSIQAMLTRVLMEEYGNGRLPHKHSTFFAQMLTELKLSTQPEAYSKLVPWEMLASINHNFLLTECKRHFLRYNGGLAYFEIAGPVAYQHYLAAAKRLNLSQSAMGYWELHIKEDERHGRWMLQDVALPLADFYPDQAWQIVLGYDQEKFMSDRAGAAVVNAIQQAEQSAPLPLVAL
jgi:Iron-containing redox enzyme